ncbi:hypothetical protein CROQUDRAFT_661507 [Cronartium quercuum f. sp. fusiforme G11]|uniref:Uncharacterized protein n=1 Tax=Cronartium quercuum f. sp. fusiforme G11 TaxID=708437 RepID=A0A9P6TA59_9BASI|nr:hypothetical protein CROQUDRAFT_661507 [Cronartium quercuum f. sp. fusiforme G11]
MISKPFLLITFAIGLTFDSVTAQSFADRSSCSQYYQDTYLYGQQPHFQGSSGLTAGLAQSKKVALQKKTTQSLTKLQAVHQPVGLTNVTQKGKLSGVKHRRNVISLEPRAPANPSKKTATSKKLAIGGDGLYHCQNLSPGEYYTIAVDATYQYHTLGLDLSNAPGYVRPFVGDPDACGQYVTVYFKTLNGWVSMVFVISAFFHRDSITNPDQCFKTELSDAFWNDHPEALDFPRSVVPCVTMTNDLYCIQ